jgi:WhiB family redox-sensing transcriptional regulator
MATNAGIGGWWGLAACQRADPELFFPVAVARIAVIQTEQAKAICARCLVRARCFDYALDTSQEHGIWGGATDEERRAIASRRRRLAARIS